MGTATKYPERSYKLYRQSITHTGKITFYKQLKSYATEVEHSLKVARVANKFSNFCCGISTVFYGEIENLPEPEEGTIYIVSAMVLAAAKEKGRTDVVAPATGHPDCVRENGFIVSVPGFVR